MEDVMTETVAAEPGDDSKKSIAAIRREGVAHLSSGAFAEAIEFLGRAVALEPNDSRTQLELGTALQAAGRHADALKCFVAVQQSTPADAIPYVRATISLLALGKVDEALRAASDACHRGPGLAQAHYSYGQAWLAANEPSKAERAFAEAIRLAPRMADAWINYGIARYRQGAIEDAKTAMRRVLGFAPNHPAASSNLAALLRVAPKSEPSEVPIADQSDSVPSDAPGPRTELRLWKPAEPAFALGLAVEFLMKEAVFARLPFGEWSQVLIGQINRGHFCFVVDRQQRVQGFLGWALTPERLAEQWVEGRASLTDEDCRDGDCVIINAWAAASTGAHRLLIDEGLRLFGRKRRIYARRYNTRGQPRPLRLSGNETADKFAAIMRAVANGRDENGGRRRR
jgi:tetratricopeptide (TPR) repeat protein